LGIIGHMRVCSCVWLNNLWRRRLVMVRKDVGCGFAWFREVPGQGSCGGSVCGHGCERAEHCVLGMARQKRLLKSHWFIRAFIFLMEVI
jgi:hypothetical protein